LEDGTLVHGDAAFKEVLVGVPNEGFGEDVKVVMLALGDDIGKELEGLLGLHGVKALACDDVIDTHHFVAKDRQIVIAVLSQRVDVLSINFEELSHAILGVDDNLVLHILALGGEGYRGLVGNLVIAEIAHGIIGKL
jgi:hypothetical protein